MEERRRAEEGGDLEEEEPTPENNVIRSFRGQLLISDTRNHRVRVLKPGD